MQQPATASQMESIDNTTSPPQPQPAPLHHQQQQIPRPLDDNMPDTHPLPSPPSDDEFLLDQILAAAIPTATGLLSFSTSALNYPFDATESSSLLHHQNHLLLSDSALLPLSLVGNDDDDHPAFSNNGRSHNDVVAAAIQACDVSVQALYNGFSGSFDGNDQIPQVLSAAAPAAVIEGQGDASTVGSDPVPVKQKVRARRGQATDPHSIAERLRRERIAERMKALQELVPNANKTDKASMLDEIIDYVKFLQLQLKVLSMNRLGGAATAAFLNVADHISSDQAAAGGGVAGRSCSNGIAQLAKLVEEDIGSAMQYLQGKGLCLMPTYLATAISTKANCPSRNTATNSKYQNPAAGLTTATASATEAACLCHQRSIVHDARLVECNYDVCTPVRDEQHNCSRCGGRRRSSHDVCTSV